VWIVLHTMFEAPTPLQTHRQLQSGQISFLEYTAPTTTTNALMVLIVAPRMFSTKTRLPGDDSDDEDNDIRHSGSLRSIPEIVLRASIVHASSAGSSSFLKENVNPPETAASSTNLQMDGETQPSATTHEVDDNTQALKDHEKSGHIDNEIKNEKNDDAESVPLRADSSVNCKQGSPLEHDDLITPEEAAAVKIGSAEDPRSAVIDVEALLRLEMKKLMDEFHFLNVPTFVYVEDKPNILTLDTNQSLESTPIVQIQVMARPISLGIILDRLERIGVGTNVGTVSVYKAELCRTASPYLTLLTQEDLLTNGSAQKTTAASSTPTVVTGTTTTTPAASINSEHIPSTRGPDPSLTSPQHQPVATPEEREKTKTERALEEARKEWKNAATRLRIEQVREQISEQACMSFDFIALLIIASILAGIGLITNSSVILVASMLVSPIMGPVMGLTFGTCIEDWSLVKYSFVNESLALTGCIVVGLLIGLPCGFTNMAETEWPTAEMQGRGEAVGLITGLAIAIPSGMGVCLSILGGNTSSLVGVAISASLLPPAVNAGLCFMQAILLASGAVSNDKGTDAKDYAVIAAISFALTALNILCIWVAGIIMFKIKEVAPTEQKGAFWERDLKAARELKKEPINLGVILDGIKSALSIGKGDEEQSAPQTTIKIKPHSLRRRSLSYSTQSPLDAAFAYHPHRRGAQIWGPEGLAKVEEEKDENVRYVGLEDMATLLGVDEEDY